MSAPPLTADPFRLLGDEMRLRVLRLLARERLNVSELTRVLGLAQSGVSRHVRLLRDGGFLEEVREGGWTWLTLATEAPTGLEAAWAVLRRQLEDAGDGHGDDARLADVLREREERHVGWGGNGGERPPEPGRSWSAWARALGHLLAPVRVVDLGCGDGALTLEVARWAASVVGIDADEAALRQARAAARAAGVRHVRFRMADLAAVPLADGVADVALLSQSLHRVPDPAAAVAEAARLTAPGGRVLVLDLLPHRETWVRERNGHAWLGFTPSEVGGWLEAAGLEDVRTEEAARRRGNPFTVLVASGHKPERSAHA